MSTHDISPFQDGDDPFVAPKSRTQESEATQHVTPPAEVGSKTPAEETTTESGNTKTSGRSSSGIAVGGKRVDVSKYDAELEAPKFSENFAVQVLYPLSEEDEHDTASYEDLYAVNKAIHTARFSLNRTQKALAQSQRQLVTAETAYRHAHARALITISGGTDKTRTAVADLETEHLYTDLLVKRAVVDEVIALVRAINRDIESLTVLSHNLRAQMNIQ